VVVTAWTIAVKDVAAEGILTSWPDIVDLTLFPLRACSLAVPTARLHSRRSNCSIFCAICLVARVGERDESTDTVGIVRNNAYCPGDQ